MKNVIYLTIAVLITTSFMMLLGNNVYAHEGSHIYEEGIFTKAAGEARCIQMRADEIAAGHGIAAGSCTYFEQQNNVKATQYGVDLVCGTTQIGRYDFKRANTNNQYHYFYTYPDQCNQTECPSGYAPDPTTGACVESNGCTVGNTKIFKSNDGSRPSTICATSDSCEYNVQQWTFYQSVGYATAYGTGTGNTCTPGTSDPDEETTPPTEPFPTDDPQEPTPDNCVTDSYGNTWCYEGTPTPPAPDNGNSGQEAQPDAQVTNTTTNNTTNVYNEQTTQESTTNAGVTDTSTVGTPGDPTEGTCNPAVEDCGFSKTGGGNTCQSPPTCTGDAIQCEIRRQAWETRCNLESEIDSVTETDVMGQVGQSQTVEDFFTLDPNNEIDLDQEVLLPTPAAGSCPPDLNVSLSMGSLTLPSGPICDVGNIVRPAVIALAYLFSALLMYQGLIRTF